MKCLYQYQPVETTLLLNIIMQADHDVTCFRCRVVQLWMTCPIYYVFFVVIFSERTRLSVNLIKLFLVISEVFVIHHKTYDVDPH